VHVAGETFRPDDEGLGFPLLVNVPLRPFSHRMGTTGIGWAICNMERGSYNAASEGEKGT